MLKKKKKAVLKPMKRLIFFFPLFLFMVTLSAGSVTLINDSMFPLFVEVLAADGSVLGKETLRSRETKKWSGGWEGSQVSQTPYTVRWFCQESGVEFSICDNIASGSSVSALMCEGEKYCKPKKIHHN